MFKKNKRREKRNETGMFQKRKMNSELIHIARASKLILTVCNCGPVYMKPDRSRFRVLQRFLYRQVLKNDQCNPSPKRHISMSGLRPLIGYDLDPDHPLSEVFNVFYTINVEVYTINGQEYTKNIITISAFVPVTQVISPEYATHCRITAVAAALDFYNYSACMYSAQSSLFPLNHDPVNAFSLTMSMPHPVEQPVIVLLGLSFVNGGVAEPHVPALCQSVKIIHVENAGQEMKPQAKT